MACAGCSAGQLRSKPDGESYQRIMVVGAISVNHRVKQAVQQLPQSGALRVGGEIASVDGQLVEGPALPFAFDAFQILLRLIQNGETAEGGLAKLYKK